MPKHYFFLITSLYLNQRKTKRQLNVLFVHCQCVITLLFLEDAFVKNGDSLNGLSFVELEVHATCLHKKKLLFC